MSIFALPGHKVKLKEDFRQGYEHHIKNAQEHLKVGQVYTVVETRVYSSSSYVYFEEVPGISFNPIQFDSIVPQSPEDDEKHPAFQKFFGNEEWYIKEREDKENAKHK